MGRPADRPNVFTKPSGILASLIYQASLRIPIPPLLGESGWYAPESIPVQTAAAGQLMLVKDPNTGVSSWQLQVTATPQDR